MSFAVPRAVVGVERVAGSRLHARNRWRLPVLLMGILFAGGRRTVTDLAAGGRIGDNFQVLLWPCRPGTQDRIGRKPVGGTHFADAATAERLLLVIDDSPTKRYGPKVEGADVHHNPTPGPADQPFSVWHVGHDFARPEASEIGPAGVDRAGHALRSPEDAGLGSPRTWLERVATKLRLAARLVEWLAPIFERAGKTVWIVIDGGYTKRPFLRRVLRIPKLVVVGRLRRRGPARPAAEAQAWPASLSRPATPVRQETSAWPSSRATARMEDRRVYAVRRDGHQDLQNVPGHLCPRRRGDSVVFVKEAHAWYAFLHRSPAGVVAILEAFADRATI